MTWNVVVSSIWWSLSSHSGCACGGRLRWSSLLTGRGIWAHMQVLVLANKQWEAHHVSVRICLLINADKLLRMDRKMIWSISGNSISWYHTEIPQSQVRSPRCRYGFLGDSSYLLPHFRIGRPCLGEVLEISRESSRSSRLQDPPRPRPVERWWRCKLKRFHSFFFYSSSF